MSLLWLLVYRQNPAKIKPFSENWLDWAYISSEYFTLTGVRWGWNSISKRELKVSFCLLSFLTATWVSWFVFNLWYADILFLLCSNPKAFVRAIPKSSDSPLTKRFCTFCVNVKYRGVGKKHISYICDRLKLAHLFSSSEKHGNIDTGCERFDEREDLKQYISSINFYGKILNRGHELSSETKQREVGIIKNAIKELYPDITFCDEVQSSSSPSDDLTAERISEIIQEFEESSDE